MTSSKKWQTVRNVRVHLTKISEENGNTTQSRIDFGSNCDIKLPSQSNLGHPSHSNPRALQANRCHLAAVESIPKAYGSQAPSSYHQDSSIDHYWLNYKMVISYRREQQLDESHIRYRRCQRSSSRRRCWQLNCQSFQCCARCSHWAQRCSCSRLLWKTFNKTRYCCLHDWQ